MLTPQALPPLSGGLQRLELTCGRPGGIFASLAEPHLAGSLLHLNLEVGGPAVRICSPAAQPLPAGGRAGRGQGSVGV